VSLGKLNCDEFAMGGSNENSAYGPARNPWDTSRVPGGSSGGSAVAVAARLVPAATGTDTGGSIRQPASFCGVTGIKPTYGRCSRYGMVAFASSLDQAGPMARSAADCATLLTAMAGPDIDRDSTSLDHPAEDYTGCWASPAKAPRPRSRSRACASACRKSSSATACAPDVLAPVRAALANTKSSAPRWSTSRCRAPSCRSRSTTSLRRPRRRSNLSRFDGVKFGHRAAQYGDLIDMYKKSRSEGFGPEVQRRIMIGTYVLSHGYYDAYYLKAQQIRRLIAQDFQQAFTQCDLIAGPAAPTVAWKIGEKSDDPVANYLADIFTLPAAWPACPA
jgi:aspartyl-tRNA(Asn)/glutamyl-tRNA(Gln) amidotransferase subunit A